MATRTVGIVGSGNIGMAVARLAVGAGLDVVISNSRGPESLAGSVSKLGGHAHPDTVENAVRAGDWVVVAIPFGRFRELPAAPFAGKVVVDTTNFDPARDAAVKGLVDGATTGELLQRHLGDAGLVKAFSSIFAGHLERLARPAGAEDRSALPIAGDSPPAKAHVTRLLDLLGWDAVDAGALSDCRRFDLGQPAFVIPYVADTEGEWWTRLATDAGIPAEAARIRDLLGAAR